MAPTSAVFTIPSCAVSVVSILSPEGNPSNFAVKCKSDILADIPLNTSSHPD